MINVAGDVLLLGLRKNVYKGFVINNFRRRTSVSLYAK